MSLNFISSSTLLASSSGLTHTETPIASTERDTALTKNKDFVPSLHTQLQSISDKKREDSDTKYKSNFSGVRGLDSEDVSHLRGIEENKNKRKMENKAVEDEEVARFIYDRMNFDVNGNGNGDDDGDGGSESGGVGDVDLGGIKKDDDVVVDLQTQTQKSANKSKFILKGKRLKVAAVNTTKVDTKSENDSKPTSSPSTTTATATLPAAAEVKANDINALLGGYSSSDSDSD